MSASKAGWAAVVEPVKWVTESEQILGGGHHYPRAMPHTTSSIGQRKLSTEQSIASAQEIHLKPYVTLFTCLSDMVRCQFPINDKVKVRSTAGERVTTAGETERQGLLTLHRERERDIWQTKPRSSLPHSVRRNALTWRQNCIVSEMLATTMAGPNTKVHCFRYAAKCHGWSGVWAAMYCLTTGGGYLYWPHRRSPQSVWKLLTRRARASFPVFCLKSFVRLFWKKVGLLPLWWWMPLQGLMRQIAVWCNRAHAGMSGEHLLVLHIEASLVQKLGMSGTVIANWCNLW